MCLLQAGNANYLQKALSNRSSNFQIIEEDAGQIRVENVVQLGPLLAIKAGGSCARDGASRTLVSLDDIRAELGPFRCQQCRLNVDEAGHYIFMYAWVTGTAQALECSDAVFLP